MPDGTRAADTDAGSLRAFQAWLDARDPAIAQARQALAASHRNGRPTADPGRWPTTPRDTTPATLLGWRDGAATTQPLRDELAIFAALDAAGLPDDRAHRESYAIAYRQAQRAQPNPKGRRGRAPRPKPKAAPRTRPKARVTLGGVRFDLTWPGQGMAGGLDSYAVTVARKRRKVDTYTIRTRDRANAAGWKTAILDAAADAARAAVAEGQLTPEEGAAAVEDAARARSQVLRREARARQTTGSPAELAELPELAAERPAAPRRRPDPDGEIPF